VLSFDLRALASEFRTSKTAMAPPSNHARSLLANDRRQRFRRDDRPAMDNGALTLARGLWGARNGWLFFGLFCRFA
jgi:hypothetical protein